MSWCHQASQVDVRNSVRASRRTGAAQIAQARHRKVLLRKTQQFRAVSAPRPAMANGPQSTVVRDAQTLGVIQHLAVVQLALFLNLREERFPANLSAVEILVPLEQIFD